jgi:glycosyltransferase involved in cell wall biosynthesis
MKNFLLSIITVTKNCAETIDKTLDSVHAVKTSEVEYIVVDGVSSDSTLESIRARGSLIDQLISEPDTGIYNAMNKGVGLARGRYVLFINGDDELVADGFPMVIDAMACRNDPILCATTLVGDPINPAETLTAVPWRLLFYNSVPHPSSFVRKDLLLATPFREDLKIVSDYDFFLGAYLSKQGFRVLPVITALHQRGGASGDKLRSQQELDMVRRQRLGWRYPILNGATHIRRWTRQLIGRCS